MSQRGQLVNLPSFLPPPVFLPPLTGEEKGGKGEGGAPPAPAAPGGRGAADAAPGGRGSPPARSCEEISLSHSCKIVISTECQGLPFGPGRLWCSSRYLPPSHPNGGGGGGAGVGGGKGEKEEAFFTPLSPLLDGTRGPSSCAEGLWVQSMVSPKGGERRRRPFRVFSAFHAGPGQLQLSANPRRRLDLIRVPSPGLIEGHNYHEKNVHFYGHTLSCSQRRGRSREAAKVEEKGGGGLAAAARGGEGGGGGGGGDDFVEIPRSKEGDEEVYAYVQELNYTLDEMRAAKKGGGSQEEEEKERVIPPSLRFSYQKHYSCDQGMCTPGGIAQRAQQLGEEDPFGSIARENPHPAEKVGEVELLRRILLDPSYQGFVLIYRGREQREDYLSQAMGYCLSRHTPTAFELGSRALELALWECDGNPAQALAWLKQHCSERHLTTAKRSFDGYSLHSTFLLRWLCQHRLLGDFQLVHYVAYSRKFFLFPFIFDLLQRRHRLKKEKGNSLLISTLKLMCNSSYGFYSLQGQSFPRTSIVRERWLNTFLQRQPERARNVVSFTLLGACVRRLPGDGDGEKGEEEGDSPPKRRIRHGFVAWRQGGQGLSSSSPSTSSGGEEDMIVEGGEEGVIAGMIRNEGRGGGGRRRRRRRRRPSLSLRELKRKRRMERERELPEEEEEEEEGSLGRACRRRRRKQGGKGKGSAAGRPRSMKTNNRVELLYAVSERRPHQPIANAMQTAIAILSESKTIMYSHVTFLLSVLGVRGGEYCYRNDHRTDRKKYGERGRRGQNLSPFPFLPTERKSSGEGGVEGGGLTFCFFLGGGGKGEGRRGRGEKFASWAVVDSIGALPHPQ